jgi:hypothetical protein
VPTVPEPASTDDLRGLLLDYLDYYRSVIASKVSGLSDDDLHGSQIPSQWTPAGLITHLAFMERRWLQWGFMGEDVDDPWGDSSGDGWVTPGVDLPTLLTRLESVGDRTREIVERHALTDHAVPGGRFPDAAAAPQLQWILLHVLQEYARHAGHLDIARELRAGSTGELG